MKSATIPEIGITEALSSSWTLSSQTYWGMLLYRGILIKLLGQRKAKGALIIVIVVVAVTEGVSNHIHIPKSTGS